MSKSYTTGMSFGMAVEALKVGMRVARAGWNGKGMWIVMMPSLYLPPYNTQEPGAKVNDRTAKHIGNDTPLDSQPYFAMWTATGKWQPGWNASTPDILAEDWGIVGISKAITDADGEHIHADGEKIPVEDVRKR